MGRVVYPAPTNNPILVPRAGPVYVPDIFEDNFVNGSGWQHTSSAGFSLSDKPTGWTAGHRGSTNQDVQIVSGAGRNGTPALRIQYSIGAQGGGRAGVTKHLTGVEGTGYTDFHLRMRIKWADDYRFMNWNGVATTPKPSLIWKCGRLLCNTDPTNSKSDWTSNADDSYEIIPDVVNNGTYPQIWPQNTYVPELAVRTTKLLQARWDPHTFSDDDSSWLIEDGGTYGQWANAQVWHTVQWHFRSSTKTSAPWIPPDGLHEMWMDGVHWQFSDSGFQQTGLSSTYIGEPCGWTSDNGVNLLIVGENVQNVSEDAGYEWTAHKAHDYFVDEVVMSTTFIPDSYNALPAT